MKFRASIVRSVAVVFREMMGDAATNREETRKVKANKAILKKRLFFMAECCSSINPQRDGGMNKKRRNDTDETGNLTG